MGSKDKYNWICEEKFWHSEKDVYKRQGKTIVAEGIPTLNSRRGGKEKETEFVGHQVMNRIVLESDFSVII